MVYHFRFVGLALFLRASRVPGTHAHLCDTVFLEELIYFVWV
jgi:hypothetical protein